MQTAGYRVIPVRPGITGALGEKAYPDLPSVPEPIDLVEVFRKAEDVDALVDEAIALKLPAIWIQLGIINEAAAERARAAGMFVVMNKCLKVEWRRVFARFKGQRLCRRGQAQNLVFSFESLPLCRYASG